MTTLTIDQRINQVRQMLDEQEAYIQKLTNLPREPEGTFVLGWRSNGLYFHPSRDHAVGIDRARLYSPEGYPRTDVRNGARVMAEKILFEDAVQFEIDRQRDLVTYLCRFLRELYQEAAASYAGRIDACVAS